MTMREVALQPRDLYDRGPWDFSCNKCVSLRNDTPDNLGLHMFLLAVCSHFENDHNIVLVGS